jgi:hypothetical protein
MGRRLAEPVASITARPRPGSGQLVNRTPAVAQAVVAAVTTPRPRTPRGALAGGQAAVAVAVVQVRPLPEVLVPLDSSFCRAWPQLTLRASPSPARGRRRPLAGQGGTQRPRPLDQRQQLSAASGLRGKPFQAVELPQRR